MLVLFALLLTPLNCIALQRWARRKLVRINTPVWKGNKK